MSGMAARCLVSRLIECLLVISEQASFSSHKADVSCFSVFQDQRRCFRPEAVITRPAQASLKPPIADYDKRFRINRELMPLTAHFSLSVTGIFRKKRSLSV